ncbi:Ku protein [Streptomyces sp. NRRL S-241]|uniref:non-homologous end joining protein Ku n=1 Tax=Streptomyces sp. NRRL S-241 TaxID=1463896 RepID=UPI0004BE712F|nr:Ku protein [Streptomyces sp. NRRL S-241]
MRPVWSGAISFGLVTIPIKVFPATESHSISFRQIHTADGGRIRYRKVCELDGEELSQEEIGRGYETATGTLVPVTDADLDAMPLPTAKAIEIVTFVPTDSIDPIQIGASYYLAAEGVAAKPYELLRRALQRSSKVAVAKFAWHNRERLGLLRVLDDVIALHAMLWPDEIRSTDQVPVPDVQVTEEEVDAAVALAETLTGLDMSQMRDEYRAALEEVIAAKAAGERPPAPAPAEPASAQVVDLMAMLEKSVQEAKVTRGESATVHPMPAKKTTAKKAAAKKTSGTAADVKKTPAKKTAKKTASKRNSPRSA